MENFYAMLDHKAPLARKTRWFLQNSMRIARQVQDINHLRARRPDKYKEALTALVNWAVDRSAAQVAELRRERASLKEMPSDD